MQSIETNVGGAIAEAVKASGIELKEADTVTVTAPEIGTSQQQPSKQDALYASACLTDRVGPSITAMANRTLYGILITGPSERSDVEDFAEWKTKTKISTWRFEPFQFEEKDGNVIHNRLMRDGQIVPIRLKRISCEKCKSSWMWTQRRVAALGDDTVCKKCQSRLTVSDDLVNDKVYETLYESWGTNAVVDPVETFDILPRVWGIYPARSPKLKTWIPEDESAARLDAKGRDAYRVTIRPWWFVKQEQAEMGDKSQLIKLVIETPIKGVARTGWLSMKTMWGQSSSGGIRAIYRRRDRLHQYAADRIHL